MDGNSFIKDIGRSYIVSSFFPAALFVLICSLLFYGFIPPTVSNWLDNSGDLFGFRWIILLIITLWIAFFLYSSTDRTVKLFEGYSFPVWIQKLMVRSLKKCWYDKAAPNYFQIRAIKNKTRLTRADKKIFSNLRRDAFAEVHEIELLAPLDEDQLLPTRLGNILRACELYPYERYKIEGITIWTRLFHVLPIPFARNLEEKNNHLLFLLHSSLLIYYLAILSFSAGLMGFICQIKFISTLDIGLKVCGLFNRGYYWISPGEYILISVVLILFGYRIYRIGVNAAEDYGLVVRAGFDLYRFELLKQMNQKLPKNLDAEKSTWEVITHYLVAGNRIALDDTQLDYDYSDQV